MPFSEIKRNDDRTGETLRSTKAFDNAIGDVREIRHIPTINESLAGQTYPGTDVYYRKHTFMLKGERVEGVFPVFESYCSVQLPRNLWMASDDRQFRYCSEKLKYQIESNPEFAAQFSQRQIEQIRNGEPRISGLTWHHNEISGKMQLVDANIHATCRHTGGKSLWGGGVEYRGAEL